MLWEDVLIVGVTPSVREGKRASILIHGRNDCNERRVWSCFANTRDVETEDGEKTKSYYWSGGLHLALGSTVGKMRDDFDAYFAAAKKQDKEALQESRSRLHEATESGAKLFTTVQESLDSDEMEVARETANKVADRLRELLVGRIIRVDWDETAQYPGPARHMCPIKPSALDGSEVFGPDSREVSSWVEEFAQGGPKSLEQSMEETLEALENDEDHDQEVAESRKQSSGSKKKKTKKKTAKKETVPSDDEEGDDESVPF